MHPKLTTFVARKQKPMTRVLKTVMLVLAVIFLLAGIMLSRGFFLPCFLMTGLYFLYELNSRRDYEYIYEDNILTINVIKGRRIYSATHTLDLQNLEVIAPHDHEAVAPYRRGGGKKPYLKYDYTSYDENTPYYTLIIYENRKPVKFLLDLDEPMLTQLKHDYPEKVYRE